MKKDIEEFFAKCLNCQQIKAEHQNPSGLLKEFQFPTWKWEGINMDFLMGLTRIQNSYDSIWVVMDWLTKSSCFIPIKSTYSEEDYARIFIDEIIYRHGIPLSSYRIGVHHSHLSLGLELLIQKEIGIVICLWWSFIIAIIFNSSISMSPYEALYGRRYNSTIRLFEVGEGIWSFKKVIRSTWKFHHWKRWLDLERNGISVLVIWVPMKSCKRLVWVPMNWNVPVNWLRLIQIFMFHA